jgi:hypothetical protein
MNQTQLKAIIKESVREILSERRGRLGYISISAERKVIGKFPFSKFPEGTALQGAIQKAGEVGGGYVRELISDSDGVGLGSVVWPDDSAMNESFGNTSPRATEMGQEDYVQIMKSDDPAAIDGFNYRLTECGVDTKKGYTNGRTTLLVRRDHLPNATDALINTGDELGEEIGRRLEEKYFKQDKKKKKQGVDNQ